MGEKRKVLVVDDDKISQDLIQETLINSGFNVIVAANGQEGLDRVYLEHPDIVICDVLMPVMDGYSFYKEMRKDEIASQIPVLILTARGKMEDTFKAVGVNSFITKPYNADILLAEIGKLLSAASTISSAPARRDAGAVKYGSGANPAQQIASKKVIVFGRDDTVLNSMNKQLQGKKCGVLVIKDEYQLPMHFDRVNPDILFLQIFDGDKRSIVDVLRELKVVIEQKFQAAEVKSLSKNEDLEYKIPYIVLYKVTEDLNTVSTISEGVLDTENLLGRCSEILPTKFIGLYAQMSFISKIKGFL